ncbi:MAG: hypothetical protein MHM6MM_001867 [Cercozoa sp. M6MM]
MTRTIRPLSRHRLICFRLKGIERVRDMWTEAQGNVGYVEPQGHVQPQAHYYGQPAQYHQPVYQQPAPMQMQAMQPHHQQPQQQYQPPQQYQQHQHPPQYQQQQQQRPHHQQQPVSQPRHGAIQMSNKKKRRCKLYHNWEVADDPKCDCTSCCIGCLTCGIATVQSREECRDCQEGARVRRLCLFEFCCAPRAVKRQH